MGSLTVSYSKPQLLFPVSSSSPSSSHPKFKFPDILRRPSVSTIKLRAKACVFPSSNIDKSGCNNNCGSNRRRILISITTLPFLLRWNQSVDDYYAKAVESDASAYMLIKEEVRKVVTKGKAAGVLRLVFHDAGTFEKDSKSGGMNGSIVYELDRPENAGLKKSIKVLSKAKSEVDAVKPVSWADMIAVAGAEAVSLCGGPIIPVILGRADSVGPDAEGKLPQESLDASGLKQCFKGKGLSTQELVALSGAHTLGGKGFGNPLVFDNSYYKILLDKPWTSSGGMSSMIGLPSDHALVEDDECLRWIKMYADDQNKFFNDFRNAYVKLVNSGAKTVPGQKAAMATTNSQGRVLRNLVLVGRTGNGKSATGNTILGLAAPKRYSTPGENEGFRSTVCPSGVTKTSQKKKVTIRDQTVNVIDTPGLFDANATLELVSQEIVKCVTLAKEGIHAFIGVLSIPNRFTEEEAMAFEVLQRLFGPKALDYMILVFTLQSDEDDYEDIEEFKNEYLSQAPKSLQDLVEKCKDRIVLVNNLTKDAKKKEKRALELLYYVNQIVGNNRGQPYSNDYFQKMQEIERKRVEAEKKVKKLEKQHKYSESEELRKRLDKELEEFQQQMMIKLKYGLTDAMTKILAPYISAPKVDRCSIL